MATLARTTCNNQIYKEITDRLADSVRTRLDQLVEHRGGRSRWDRLKREPKQPGVREVASFLLHIEEMTALEEGLPFIESLSMPKRTQLVIEARALDIADMRALKPNERFALTVLLIQAQLQKAMDDIAEIFIKTVRSMHHIAEDRLRQYHLDHADQTERLIGQFRDVLSAFHRLRLPGASNGGQGRGNRTVHGPAGAPARCRTPPGDRRHCPAQPGQRGIARKDGV
jgi:hypothetical protein